MNTRRSPCVKCIEGGRGALVRWHSRVASLGPAGSDEVVLERALPVNVTQEWSPTVYRFMKGISEVGIEYLTIEMK